MHQGEINQEVFIRQGLAEYTNRSSDIEDTAQSAGQLILRETGSYEQAVLFEGNTLVGSDPSGNDLEFNLATNKEK